jgi:hypothetical protein
MCRELRETFQRLDSFAQEVKRKDSKMKELQQRLEAGQGCKLPSLVRFELIFLKLI